MIELVCSIPSEILHSGKSSVTINTATLSSSPYSSVTPYILKTPFPNSGTSAAKEGIRVAQPQITSPTLADVFRCYGDGYLRTHSVPEQHQQVMEAIRKACAVVENTHHRVIIGLGRGFQLIQLALEQVQQASQVLVIPAKYLQH